MQNFSQKTKRLIAKSILAAVTLFTQFHSFFTGEKIIGYPFNFISYSGKFDTYTFFLSRLGYSAVFWAVIIFIFVKLIDFHFAESA